jgi:hypothetical protein
VTEDGSGDPYHHTYHENGYMHFKWRASATKPDNQPRYYGPSLENFEGFVPASGLTPVPKEVGKIVSPDFDDDEQGYDNITYIDVRNTEKGMTYQSFICESGFPVGRWIRENSNSDINTDIDQKLSYQIYTEPDPWVGVAHWQQASGIQTLDPTSHFRPLGAWGSIEEHRYLEPCPNGYSGCDGPDGTGPLCIECCEVID